MPLRPSLLTLLACSAFVVQAAMPDPFVESLKGGALQGDALAKAHVNELLAAMEMAPAFPERELRGDLLKLAASGHAHALYVLGFGDSHSPSEVVRREGLAFLQRAANLGYPLAQRELAIQTWREDLDKAKSLWRSALANFTQQAQEGNVDAMWTLGSLAPPLDAAPRDFPCPPEEDAISWLRRAASQGHFPSVLRLAKILGAEKTSKAAQEESWKWYTMAAENGCWRALLDMGLLYEYGYSRWKPSFLGRNHAKAWEMWDRVIAVLGQEEFYRNLPFTPEEMPPRK